MRDSQSVHGPFAAVRSAPRRRRLRRATTVLGLALAVSACDIGEPAAVRCQRYELGVLGPENGFRMVVPAAETRVLDASSSQLIVDMAVVPPASGPVSLVHVVDSIEVERWTLSDLAVSGVTVNCRIGTNAKAGCGARLAVSPQPLAGYYYLVSADTRVLEAGIAAYLCDS